MDSCEDSLTSSWFSLNIYIFCECININTTLNFFRININHCTRSVLDFNCFWYRFFFLSHIIMLEQEFIKFYSRHFTYRQSLKTHAEGPKWKREECAWSNVKCIQTLCNCRVDANVYCSKTLRFKGNQTRKFRKIINNEIPLSFNLRLNHRYQVCIGENDFTKSQLKSKFVFLL